ncbi:MAG: hypothetical protein R3A12_08925 [Ignavibacteria bacterium]
MSKKIHFTFILLFLTISSGSIYSQSSKSYKYKPIAGSETGKANINSQPSKSTYTEDNKFQRYTTEGGYPVEFSSFSYHLTMIISLTDLQSDLVICGILKCSHRCNGFTGIWRNKISYIIPSTDKV